jgi:hypothetical protein
VSVPVTPRLIFLEFGACSLRGAAVLSAVPFEAACPGRIAAKLSRISIYTTDSSRHNTIEYAESCRLSCSCSHPPRFSVGEGRTSVDSPCSYGRTPLQRCTALRSSDKQHPCHGTGCHTNADKTYSSRLANRPPAAAAASPTHSGRLRRRVAACPQCWMRSCTPALTLTWSQTRDCA